MSNHTRRFSIVSNNWSIGIQDTDGNVNSISNNIVPENIVWEPLSKVQELVNGTVTGGVLDLNNRYFHAEDLTVAGSQQAIRDRTQSGIENELELEIGQKITIKNGNFAGTRPIAWTADAQGGLLRGGIDSGISADDEFDIMTATGTVTPTDASPGDLLGYLVDFRDDTLFTLGVYPPPPSTQGVVAERKDYTAAYSPTTWFQVRPDGVGGVNKGDIIQRAWINGELQDSTTETTNVPGNFGSSDVEGTRITKVVITDDDMLSDISNQLDGKDASKLIMIFRSGPNTTVSTRINSWDPNTGTLDITGSGMYYSGYFQFAITGHEDWLVNEGQFILDYTNKKIVMKPYTNLGHTQDGTDIEVSAIPTLFLLNSHGDVTIENCTMRGANANSSAPSCVTKTIRSPLLTQLENGKRRCKLINVRGEHSYQMTRGDVDFDSCYFNNFRHYICTSTDGCVAQRSFFGICEIVECLTVFAAGSNDDDTEIPVLHSHIKDCIFFNPITTHGQGLSLYTSAWQNATVEHCLFVDCTRSYSMQSRSDKLRHPAGEFIFKNNLILYDRPLEQTLSGQYSFAFNGSNGDDHIDTGDDGVSDQVVMIYNNTIALNPSWENIDFDTETASGGLDTVRMWASKCSVYNNVAGIITAARHPDDDLSNENRVPPGPTAENDPDFRPDTPHRHRSNLQYAWDDSKQAWGSLDIANPTGYTTNSDNIGNSSSLVMDYSNLEIKNQYLTAASDGARVGYRWSGGLTIPKVRNLMQNWDPHWHLRYPQESVTTPAAYPISDITSDREQDSVARASEDYRVP